MAKGAALSRSIPLCAGRRHRIPKLAEDAAPSREAPRSTLEGGVAPRNGERHRAPIWQKALHPEPAKGTTLRCETSWLHADRRHHVPELAKNAASPNDCLEKHVFSKSSKTMNYFTCSLQPSRASRKPKKPKRILLFGSLDGLGGPNRKDIS